VTDTLPGDVLSDTITTNIDGATCDASANPIICSLGSLDVGQTAGITITASAKSTASGSLENQATVGSEAQDPDPSFNSDSVTTPVVDLADLRLTKAASAASVVAGEQLTYTLTITNDGPSLASNVRVTDTLPVSTSFSSATPSAGSCGESGGDVVCSLGDLAVDGEAQITLVINVDPAASGTLENSATAGSDAFDPNSANNQPSVFTTVSAEADLRLAKAASAASVVAGEQLIYTLTITNDGPSLATGVRVTDTLPVSTSVSSATPSAGTCGPSGGDVVCSLGDLAFGGEAQITLVVNVDPAASGSLQNSATAGSDAFDPNSANNQPSVMTAVTAEADLSLSKSADPGAVYPGGQLTYTLTIVNDGPSVASGVRDRYLAGRRPQRHDHDQYRWRDLRCQRQSNHLLPG